MVIMDKLCNRCKRTLSPDNFHRNRSKRDGLGTFCKECTQKLKAQYQVDHKDRVTASSQRWRAKNREHARRIDKASRQRTTERKRLYNRQYAIENREKRRAHGSVKEAVKVGKLPPIDTQTCVKCGQQAHHYHHEDYSRRLDVIPLCGSCHQYVHLNAH